MTTNKPKSQFTKLVAVLLINAVILSYIALQTDEERYEAAMEAYQEQNFSKTYNIMSSLAHQDNPEAAYFLGTLYSNGQGAEVDEAEAMSWYKKAASLGNEQAKKLLSRVASNTESEVPANTTSSTTTNEEADAEKNSDVPSS